MAWIVADSAHLGGRPRVSGTRISIEFLLECLASGMTIPEIVAEYPTLTEEAIKGRSRSSLTPIASPCREDSAG
jgi:uncharacterized protein (DUF433 family)